MDGVNHHDGVHFIVDSEGTLLYLFAREEVGDLAPHLDGVAPLRSCETIDN